MSQDHILAIDVGTQSIRALLFDPQGSLIHKVQVHIEPYFSKQPGLAEQDPDYFWQHLCTACQQQIRCRTEQHRFFGTHGVLSRDRSGRSP